MKHRINQDKYNNMKLYVFPDNSIDYFNECNAMDALLKRVDPDNTKQWYSWPELCLTTKQLQMFKPNQWTMDIIISNNPFIISAFKQKDIVVCKCSPDKVVIKKNQPDFQTFGSSYDYILTKMFDVKILISEEAIKFMQKAIKSSSKHKVLDAISSLGESFEKRFLYERACVLEKKQKAVKK